MKSFLLSFCFGMLSLMPLHARGQNQNNFFLSTNGVVTNASIYRYCYATTEGVVTLTIPESVVVQSRCSNSNFSWNFTPSVPNGIVSISYEGEFNSTARLVVRGTFQLLVFVNKTYNFCGSGGCSGPSCISTVAQSLSNSSPFGPGQYVVNVTGNSVPQSQLDAMTMTAVSPICTGTDLTVQVSNWSPGILVTPMPVGYNTAIGYFGSQTNNLPLLINNGNGSFTFRSSVPISPATYTLGLSLSSPACGSSRNLSANAVVEGIGSIVGWSYRYAPPGTSQFNTNLPSSICLGPGTHSYIVSRTNFPAPANTRVRWSVVQPSGNQIVSNPDVVLDIQTPYNPSFTGSIGAVSITATFVPTPGFSTTCPTSSLPPIPLQVTANPTSSYSYRYNGQTTLPAYICGDESVGYQVISSNTANPPILVQWSGNAWISQQSIQPTSPSGSFIPRATVPTGFNDGIIRAVVTNTCGSVTLSDINVKIGRPPVTITTPDNVCYNQPFAISLTKTVGGDAWYTPTSSTSSNFILQQTNQFGSTWLATPTASSSGRTVELSFVVNGLCGTPYTVSRTVNVRSVPRLVLPQPRHCFPGSSFVARIEGAPVGATFALTPETQANFIASGSFTAANGFLLIPRSSSVIGNQTITLTMTNPAGYCPTPYLLTGTVLIEALPGNGPFTISRDRSDACMDQPVIVDVNLVPGATYQPSAQTAADFVVERISDGNSRARFRCTPRAGVSGTKAIAIELVGYCSSTLSAQTSVVVRRDPQEFTSSSNLYWFSGSYQGQPCSNMNQGEWVQISMPSDASTELSLTEWKLLVGGQEVASSTLPTFSFMAPYPQHYNGSNLFEIRLRTRSVCGTREGFFNCQGVIQSPTCPTSPCPPEQQFSLSPNPADGELAIALDEVTNQPQAIAVEPAKAKDVQRTYQIFNTGGRLMRSGTMAGARDNVSLSGLPTGTYHLVLLENGKMVGRKTFVKQ